MKTLEDAVEKENNRSFLQRCLKVPMLFLGVIIDDNLLKYKKLFNLLLFIFWTIIIVPSSAFLLSTNNIEYKLDSVLCTGVNSLTFYSLWKFKRKSNDFLQIYHKSVNSERTTIAFLKICVTNTKKYIFVTSLAFGIILSLIVTSIILVLSVSSNMSYDGSPAQFYYPVRYPWPMDRAGWYYFSLIFNFTAAVPHNCAFVALQHIIIFLRVIIQTHQHLILVKVKNLDNLATKGKRTWLETNEFARPEEVMMDELRDIIRYHQFCMK